MVDSGKEKTAPGDQGEPGSPQTAENICPRCNGNGAVDNNPCPNCAGSGKVIEIVGDA